MEEHCSSWSKTASRTTSTSLKSRFTFKLIYPWYRKRNMEILGLDAGKWWNFKANFSLLCSYPSSFYCSSFLLPLSPPTTTITTTVLTIITNSTTTKFSSRKSYPLNHSFDMGLRIFLIQLKCITTREVHTYFIHSFLVYSPWYMNLCGMYKLIHL